MPGRAKLWAFRLLMAVIFLWPSIEASLLGRLDLTGMAFGLHLSGFVPTTWTDLARNSLLAYLAACLVWTIARRLLKTAAAWSRHVAAKVRRPQEHFLYFEPQAGRRIGLL